MDIPELNGAVVNGDFVGYNNIGPLSAPLVKIVRRTRRGESAFMVKGWRRSEVKRMERLSAK